MATLLRKLGKGFMDCLTQLEALEGIITVWISPIERSILSTLTKGKNHLSYLGLLYGLGVGIENLNHSYNTNLQSSTAYPLATLGLNFEKFLGTSVALFIRVDGDATMMAVSQKLKGNVGIGLKVKL